MPWGELRDVARRSGRWRLWCCVLAALYGCAEGPLVPAAPSVEAGVEEGAEGTAYDRSGPMVLGINTGFYDPSSGKRVFRDGYVPSSWRPGDEPFDPVFLEEMSGFRTIRFHQFHHVSFSNDVEWSDRPPPDMTIPTRGWHEVVMPYEWEIRLCNALGANYWLNVPALADSSYVAELAALVERELDPGLRVYLEYSNEVWNPDYAEGSRLDERPGLNGQHTVAAARGQALGLSPSGNAWEARAKYSVYASVRIWEAFLDEFDDDGRVVMVLGSMNDDDPEAWYARWQLQALGDTAVVNPRALRPDFFSIPAFLGWGRDGASPALFESELAQDLEGVVAGIHIARTTLDENGYADVPIDLYEGGIHMTTHADVASRDPRMYDWIIRLLDAAEATGAASFHFYSATHRYFPWMASAFNEYTGQPREEAHIYRAIRDWQLDR